MTTTSGQDLSVPAGAAPTRLQPVAVGTRARTRGGQQRPTGWVRFVGYLMAVLGASIGLLGMSGWIFKIGRFRQVLPDQPFIRFNAALCLALLGLAWLLPRLLRVAFAVVAAVVALITLAEYVFRVRGAGIDELFVRDPGTTGHPGRMAIMTAMSVLLLAGGRIAVEFKHPRWARWSAAVVVVTAVLTLLADVYNVSWLYRLRPVSTLAAHTVVGLLLLGLATMAADPGARLMWSVRSEDSGAILLRRLLPAALVGLPIVGAVALLGQRHRLYDATTTAAVIVMACTLVIALMTWAAAVRLSRADRRRSNALAELTELKDDLERQVQQRAQQLQQQGNEIAILEDRQRIAADLHDIVIQRLFAAGMFLQGGAAYTSDPETRDRLDTAVEAMDAAIKDLRASIFELGARREFPIDLATAANTVCAESARVLGFLPDLVVDDPEALGELVRDDVLAVLREALANVARHAKATRVDVRLSSDDAGLVSLTVTDNGLGMRAASRSSGTRNMVLRAREHGGDCTWTPVDPTGTRVNWCARVPVNAGS